MRSLQRGWKDAQEHRGDALDREEREERREVDPAHERQGAADRREDRLGDAPDELAEAPREAHRYPGEQDAHEDREGERLRSTLMNASRKTKTIATAQYLGRS